MFEHYHGSNGKIDFVSSIHSSGIINYRTLGQQAFNLGPWHTMHYVKVEVRTISRMLVLSLGITEFKQWYKGYKGEGV